MPFPLMHVLVFPLCQFATLYITSSEYFLATLAAGHSLEYEWQQISSNIQDSSQYCDVVCYREREREASSPTLLSLNQRALRLTVKMTYEWRSHPLTLWPAFCWTNKGIQVTRVSWPDWIVREGKNQMIGP